MTSLDPKPERTIWDTTNTLFPLRPDYVRPDRADDYQPTRVTAPAMTVEGTVTEQAHATFTNAKTSFERFLNDIPREHYSPDGLKAQIAKFSDTIAAKAVDAAVDSVRDRADKASTQLEKIRRDLSPNGDTAAELRAGRYWDRTKPLLDNAKEGALAKAQNLITTADREQLGVLLQELPAYLEARNYPTEWIDAAIGQAVPEYAQAAARNKKAQQALTIAQYNATSLRESFANGYSSGFITDARNYDPDK